MFEFTTIEDCGDYRPIDKNFHVYQIFKVPMPLHKIQGLADRPGFEWRWDRLAPCECGSKDFILLPIWSTAVKQGGKHYLVCAHCGGGGAHL